MKALLIICVLLFPVRTCIYSQNVMWIDTVQVITGQGFNVSVKVNNVNKFVAFQFDIQFPSEAVYNVNSAVLTARANGHQLAVSQTGTNKYRFIAFSLSQSHFTGNTGPILNFTCTAGNLPGTYPLILLNPILGDSNNTNILNSYYNGQVCIQLPTNIKEETKDKGYNFNIYPNPFNSSVKFKIKSNLITNEEIKIFDTSGKLINILTLKENEALWNGTDRSGKLITSGVYFAAYSENNKSTIKRVIFLK